MSDLDDFKKEYAYYGKHRKLDWDGLEEIYRMAIECEFGGRTEITFDHNGKLLDQKKINGNSNLSPLDTQTVV